MSQQAHIEPVFSRERGGVSVLFPISLSWRGKDATSVAVVGWGFDAEQPLRPWPTLRSSWEGTLLLHLVPERVHVRTCLAWCGFFVNIGTQVDVRDRARAMPIPPEPEWHLEPDELRM